VQLKGEGCQIKGAPIVSQLETRPRKAKARATERVSGPSSDLATNLTLYRTDPIGRLSLIKKGIPAIAAKRLFSSLLIDQKVILKAVDLKTSTINKKAALDSILTPNASERILGVARLIGQVEAMDEESGNLEEFDAMAWFSEWLQEPLPALGGARPIEFLDTIEGQTLVSQMLSRIQSGAYA
jgi:putative toxin-antitoxin system antitoxin component (TIGR02293 family)